MSTTVNGGRGGNDHAKCAAGWLPNDNGIDVTNMVGNWTRPDGKPNNGVALVAPDPTKDSSYKQFNSANASGNTPLLRITKFVPPPAPRNVVVRPLSGYVPAAIGSAHPTVTATAPSYDATGGKLYLEFKVTDNTGATRWSSRPVVSANQTVAQQVTATLSDSAGYTASVRSSVNLDDRIASSWVSVPFKVDTNPFVGEGVVVPSEKGVTSGRIFTPTTTPQLGIPVLESVPNERFHLQFRLWNSATSKDNPLRSFDIDNVPQGTYWWQVPAGVLADGQTYYWAVWVRDEDSPSVHEEHTVGFTVDVQAPCQVSKAVAGLRCAGQPESRRLGGGGR